MALTQDEWFKKLREMVPSWVFERDVYNKAIWQGMAKIMREAQLSYESHIGETFIGSAEGDFLDLHASERGVIRGPNDSTDAYRDKIRNILNKSNCPDLKELTDAILIKGESTFIENYNAQVYLSREGHLNRNIIFVEVIYNAFTIIVDSQIPDPVLFCDREDFLDREDIIGTAESLLRILENIILVINKNKAFGAAYSLIERSA